LNGVVAILVAHRLVEENDSELIKIISARKATKHEVARYEKLTKQQL
jgi:uncharacterized DUF497 family protein